MTLIPVWSLACFHPCSLGFGVAVQILNSLGSQELKIITIFILAFLSTSEFHTILSMSLLTVSLGRSP